MPPPKLSRHSSSSSSCALPPLGALALACACLWAGYVAGVVTGRPAALPAASTAAAREPDAAALRGLAAPAAAANAVPAVAGFFSAASGSAAAAAAAAAPAATAATAASSAIFSVCHRRMTTRGELPTYLKDLGLLERGAEVGVRDGEFSAHLLRNWPGHLTLVDPWKAQDTKIYNDFSNVEQKEQDERFELVTRTMRDEFPGRATILRDFSVEAAKTIADGSLSFVYIDARHDYEGVLEDLRAWAPKVRAGGLIAGHDFVPDGQLKEGAFGVQRAASEFALELGREVMSSECRGLSSGGPTAPGVHHHLHVSNRTPQSPFPRQSVTRTQTAGARSRSTGTAGGRRFSL